MDRRIKLAKALVEALSERKMTVAAAESCTGGLVTAALTSVSGASAVLEYSAVTYANRIKESVLGVSHETLVQYGAVSEPCAKEMARGIRKAANADLGIAVTGIAGPTGGTPEKPVGTVYIAAATEENTFVERLQLSELCGNDREAIRGESVCRVLELALRALGV